MCCSKNYQHKFAEKLRNNFFNTYKYSHCDNGKFILLLWRCVYLCEYIDDWEKFSETSLPEKEDFYSYLNMKHITDADYAMQKEFVKILKLKI